jgi:hypothetical protein
MKIDNILNIIIIILFIIILIAIFFYPWKETETIAPTIAPIIAPIPIPIPRPRQRPSQTPIPGQTETQTETETETESICIERTPEEWKNINEICDPLNNTTLITNRSRQISIIKTNGENECSFKPLTNETILETDTDKGFLNSNQKIQFVNFRFNNHLIIKI